MTPTPVPEPGTHKILIVDDTPANLDQPFLYKKRGIIIMAKGVGALHTWFLAGRRSALSE